MLVSTNREVKICPKGVLKPIGSLKTTKSCGPDFITAKFLKTFAEFLVNSLSKIFQFSITNAALPKVWKHARVAPIFKKGSKQLTKNYRPISLTSTCCKLLEHIVHSIISDHLESEGNLTDSQHGFRAKRSCETQQVSTMHDLTQRFEKGETIDVVILDFAKAFDTVSHNLLLFKLDMYGISNVLLN